MKWFQNQLNHKESKDFFLLFSAFFNESVATMNNLENSVQSLYICVSVQVSEDLAGACMIWLIFLKT